MLNPNFPPILAGKIFRIRLSVTMTQFQAKAIHKGQMPSKLGHRLLVQTF